MRSKGIIFIFTFVFLTVTVQSTAQVDQTSELEVRLNPIITFTLNDVNPTLIFDDADDFINGVMYTANNAAVVTASAPFSIKVESDKNHLRDSAGNKIKTKSISIEAIGDNIGNTTKWEISPAKREIISGAPAGISKTFGLKYSTEGNDTEFIGKPAGDYTVELTFIATLD